MKCWLSWTASSLVSIPDDDGLADQQIPLHAPTGRRIRWRGCPQTWRRWSPRGRRVAYASSSLSLASLEVLVNLNREEDAPRDLAAVELTIPNRIRVEILEKSQLPENWRNYPYPLRLQEIGARWLDAGTSVCLLVPSVVIPQELNFLINPLHADFGSLIFRNAVPFVFDPRVR